MKKGLVKRLCMQLKIEKIEPYCNKYFASEVQLQKLCECYYAEAVKSLANHADEAKNI